MVNEFFKMKKNFYLSKKNYLEKKLNYIGTLLLKKELKSIQNTSIFISSVKILKKNHIILIIMK